MPPTVASHLDPLGAAGRRQLSVGSLRIAQKTDLLFYRRVAKQNEPRRPDAAAAGKHHKTMNTQEQNLILLGIIR